MTLLHWALIISTERIDRYIENKTMRKWYTSPGKVQLRSEALSSILAVNELDSMNYYFITSIGFVFSQIYATTWQGKRMKDA